MVDNIYKYQVQTALLGDIVNIRAARRPERVESYPFDSSLPYVNIRTLELGTPGLFTENSGGVMDKNDLVIVKDGSRSGKVFYAQEGVAASTLAVLSPKSDELNLNYLYCYLTYSYDDFQSRLRGSTIVHLDMNYLRQLKVPYPDVRMQNEIAEKYHNIEKLVNRLREKTLRLKEISIEAGNVELKKLSDNLNAEVDLIQKSWLHQVFKKTI